MEGIAAKGRIDPAPARLQRLLPELLELPERPLLLFLLLLLLLPRDDDPWSFMPPRWRLLSDWLREELLPLRDELPDPDDLFDGFAIANAPQVAVCR